MMWRLCSPFLSRTPGVSIQLNDVACKNYLFAGRNVRQMNSEGATP